MDHATSAPMTRAYALGHAREEQERLDRQGEVLRAATEAWLRRAGITDGLRVLDVGCGTGDVSRLVAEMVGPSGSVLGIDRSPDVIATARRSAEARGLSQVEFVEAEINAFATDEQFDALVGRLVLMYQPDPAATIRHLVRFVRPGGIVAFADYCFTPPAVFPTRPLFAHTFSWVVETLRVATPSCDLAARLHTIFVAAGLPRPEVRFEIAAGVGADESLLSTLSDVARSLAPLADRLGICSAAETQIETLHERLMAEAAAIDGTAFGPIFGMASATLPA